MLNSGIQEKGSVCDRKMRREVNEFLRCDSNLREDGQRSWRVVGDRLADRAGEAVQKFSESGPPQLPRINFPPRAVFLTNTLERLSSIERRETRLNPDKSTLLLKLLCSFQEAVGIMSGARHWYVFPHLSLPMSPGLILSTGSKIRRLLSISATSTNGLRIVWFGN